MLIKIPKMKYETSWQEFFSAWNINFISQTDTEDSLYLRIAENPSEQQRTEIENAIIALGNKIYWSDDTDAGNIFGEAVAIN